MFVITGFNAVKRDKQLGILSLGGLVHTAITALTMPASYHKYFYEMVLFAYFFIIIILIDFHLNSRKLKMKG